MRPSPTRFHPRSAARARTAEPRTGTWLRWLLALAAAAAPIPLMAQNVGSVGDGFYFRRPILSLSVRGGYERPTAGSDIYGLVTEQLTVNRGDFATGGYQVDLGVRLSERAEIVLTAGNSSRDVASEFRRYVDNNDLPIEQSTRLQRFPVSLGVRYAVTAPGERISKFAWIPSRITPWVGAGAGVMSYTFSQTGDFVDFETLNVFRDEYKASGWAPMAYASLGTELRLTTRFSLMGDLRYTASRGSMNASRGAFVGFDKIDLSGGSASLGLTMRL
ncbi:MAG: hypothetical protein IT355_17120 [Gemmatimonadaceae bacterium]|nr:hypothetical protein [Gemmatimonadaceae bacterium]